MKLKIYSVIFGLISVVIAVAVTGSSVNKPQPTPQDETESGLAWYVRKAKAQGKDEIIVPAPRSRIAVAKSLDDALSRYSAVIATPVESKSFVLAPHKIGTWYKFRVVEYLTQREQPTCPACPEPMETPSELSPPGEDEILILRSSGTVVIEGVKVTSLESGFPPFQEAQQYLLFLDLASSSKVARLRMGPYGVFTVGAGGDIKPINDRNHPFKGDLEPQEGKGSALEQLRGRAQNRQD